MNPGDRITREGDGTASPGEPLASTLENDQNNVTGFCFYLGYGNSLARAGMKLILTGDGLRQAFNAYDFYWREARRIQYTLLLNGKRVIGPDAENVPENESNYNWRLQVDELPSNWKSLGYKVDDKSKYFGWQRKGWVKYMTTSWLGLAISAVTVVRVPPSGKCLIVHPEWRKEYFPKLPTPNEIRELVS